MCEFVFQRQIELRESINQLTNKSVFAIPRSIHRIPKVNFINILQKNTNTKRCMYRKAAHEILNFTNILRTAFATISLYQKITKSNCNKRKAMQNTFVQKATWKILIKFTPDVINCFFQRFHKSGLQHEVDHLRLHVGHGVLVGRDPGELVSIRSLWQSCVAPSTKCLQYSYHRYRFTLEICNWWLEKSPLSKTFSKA